MVPTNTPWETSPLMVVLGSPGWDGRTVVTFKYCHETGTQYRIHTNGSSGIVHRHVGMAT